MMHASDGQEGTATIMESGTTTVVRVDVTPAAADPQPVYFQISDCSSIGPVQIGLEPVINGQSETTLDMLYDDLVGEHRWLIVLRSENAVWVLTACGERPAPSS